MESVEIRARIKQIIARVADLDPGQIGDHAILSDELHLDSLSLLEIGVDVDYAFKLGLPDEQYREIQGLDDMVELVARHLQRVETLEPAEPVESASRSEAV